MDQVAFFLVLILMVLFVPLLPGQQQAGHLDYGIYAHLQIPLILLVLFVLGGWLYRRKSKGYLYAVVLPLAYMVVTAATNLAGERFLQVDHSKDLPIRNRLVLYSPPHQPPTRAQIVADCGEPLASAFPSTTNVNVPGDVMTSLRYAPRGVEVLVYEETARNGRHFTYFIFIDPGTGRKGFHVEVPGTLRDDEWPNQPLR